MKQSRLRSRLLALVLVFATPLAAQEKGTWRAASKTASAITGDIAFSADKFSINFTSFPMSQIRPLQPAELKAAFDLDGEAVGRGNLYKVNIPATKKFLRKNSLCGADDTQWMVSYISGHDLRIAFFSGGPMPLFTPEAIATTTNLCGTFAYVR